MRERVERADLGEDDIRRRLATHYVPYNELAVGNYGAIGDQDARAEKVRSDYETFLDKRADLLLEPIAALCRGDLPPPPSDSTVGGGV